jgi:hypothetical protein
VKRGKIQYLEGLYGWESDRFGQRFRWTNGDSLLGVPTPSKAGDFALTFLLAASRLGSAEVNCQIYLEELCLASWTISGNECLERTLTVPERLREKSVRLQQNTGSIVFRSGMSRDRGTYIHNNEVLFEVDQGQYARVEEVFSGCGASILLKREMLADVGKFDDDFFMYYEDTDLCWRARLQGWVVLYAPDAIVRHIHCGTTMEWSHSFVYLTDRNRLAMVMKNGSSKQVVWVWGGFLMSVLKNFLKSMLSVLLFRQNWRQFISQLWTQVRVLVTLIKWQPRLWQRRLEIQRKRRVPHKLVETWFRE